MRINAYIRNPVNPGIIDSVENQGDGTLMHQAHFTGK